MVALVVVGSFAVPDPEPIVLDISVSDITIEPIKEVITAPKPAPITKPKPVPVVVSKPPVIEIPTSTPIVEVPAVVKPLTPSLPPLTQNDLENIMYAVVRIRCGGTYGSGAVIRVEDKRYALTAAHVVVDRIAAKKETCDIIFPRKDDFGVFKEAYYRPGKILAPEQTQSQYKNNAHDIAVLEILPIEEDARVFPDGQPFVNYAFCPANTLQDDTLLIGYPINAGTTATPGGVISKFPGVVAQYSDIDGVEARAEAQFSGGFAYYPILKNTKDTTSYHPITISVSTNNFSGASGGLVFNISKQCVLGINTATGSVNNVIYGISMNPAFQPIVDFLETAMSL
ncbi:MAG: hypothetical protein G01um10143_625 [Parcubacteria group bacterium Gr01-1014_3]|nr:MAG: hypothetical protein G01um10143_625 [Parcubacteria group bacterium Gr01-1014_3]